MTKKKHEKRLVREEMARTGDNYTTAKSRLERREVSWGDAGDGDDLAEIKYVESVLEGMPKDSTPSTSHIRAQAERSAQLAIEIAQKLAPTADIETVETMAVTLMAANDRTLRDMANDLGVRRDTDRLEETFRSRHGDEAVLHIQNCVNVAATVAEALPGGFANDMAKKRFIEAFALRILDRPQETVEELERTFHAKRFQRIKDELREFLMSTLISIHAHA